jgi:hypothetical protein
MRLPILLSPRNARISGELAARFSRVAVAPTNQAVLDGSDIVMLAVRPQIAVEALSALKFQPDHHVVSLIATFSRDAISALVAPARKITRAVRFRRLRIGWGPRRSFRQIATLPIYSPQSVPRSKSGALPNLTPIARRPRPWLPILPSPRR